MSGVWPLGRDAVYTSPREFRPGLVLQDGSWLPASWHYGCDWAAETGTLVRAAHDGVAQQLWEPGAGHYVNLVAHDGSVRSMYMHLDGFGQGGPVTAGDIIGYVGSTGMSTGPHLHFQVHEPAAGWPSAEPVAWLIRQELDQIPGQVVAWCRAHGLSDAGAAGVLGNLQQESTLNPAIVEGMTYHLEDLEPGVREGIGLLQWSYDRRVALLDYARSVHRPWQQPEVQLDFMLGEIEADARIRAMWERMRTHTDPRAASRDFSNVFVRPGHYGPRDDYAAQFHARITAGEFAHIAAPAGTARIITAAATCTTTTPTPTDGADDMFTRVNITRDLPEGKPAYWGWKGSTLAPLLDPHTSGEKDVISMSWGQFLVFYGEHHQVTRQNALTGEPLESAVLAHLDRVLAGL